MRIELRDGQWAELRESLTHGEDKALRKAAVGAKEQPEQQIDWESLIVRTFTTAWHVIDRDGNAIPLSDEDAIERAPADIVDELVGKAVPIFRGVAVPNEPTPPRSARSRSKAQ